MKIKFVDPFFNGRKTGLHLKPSSEKDLPPNIKVGRGITKLKKGKKYKKLSLDHEDQGSKSFMKMIESIQQVEGLKRKRKKKANKAFVPGDNSEENMKRFSSIRVGESIESYSARIDLDTKNRLREVPKKQVSSRRKEKVKLFMKKRKEKAKQKKLQKVQHVRSKRDSDDNLNSEDEDESNDSEEEEEEEETLPRKHKNSKHFKDFNELQDKVEFGEVANCPPTLTSTPKRKLKNLGEVALDQSEMSLGEKARIPQGVKEKFFGSTETSEKSESDLARERSLQVMRLRVRENYKQNKKNRLGDGGDTFRL